jgi:glycosyltransferase involved in cell wall biosynthesis
MRPLLLISGLATGGAERVTVSFMRYLAGTGADVVACTVTSRRDGPLAEELARAGVERHDLGARRISDPLALARLIRLLRRGRFSLVHAHGPEACMLAGIACTLTRVPLVITRHVLDEATTNWRLRQLARMTVFAARRAAAVVAVSYAVAGRLEVASAARPGAVHVIPNGVELERFNDPALSLRREDIRRALGVEPDDRLVLLPAVLREGKGHEVLIDALREIKTRVPGARLAFAGGGELEGALRARAERHGDAVMFLGQREDVPELLAACDLVVLPSMAEALPTALIEAAAAGRPVVATRVGGTPEVVLDGETGLLVPPDDPAALAAAVVTVLTDCERARALGEAGRRRALSLFSIRAQVERTVALWSRVLSAGGK